MGRKTKMKIYLIRHGQTTGDIENRYGGDYDDELTDEGKIQAHKLADKIADSGIQVILCSPLIRAQQTIRDLKERNQNGILTGMIREEAKLKYPELSEQVKDYRNQIQGAESYEDFVARMKKAIMEISNTTNYSTIGIVTHGGPIRVVFREILKDREIDIADCAYAILNSEGQTLTLEARNGIEYKTD
jgi:broad specificity phosphatase PhoE